MSRSIATSIENDLAILADREAALEQACMAEAESRHAFDIKSAREFLNAEGTVDARKALATLACDKEYLEHLKTKAVKEFTKAKWTDALQAVSAHQSILSASVKGDFSHAISGIG